MKSTGRVTIQGTSSGTFRRWSTSLYGGPISVRRSARIFVPRTSSGAARSETGSDGLSLSRRFYGRGLRGSALRFFRWLSVFRILRFLRLLRVGVLRVPGVFRVFRVFGIFGLLRVF